jgi:hypothetical protein
MGIKRRLADGCAELLTAALRLGGDGAHRLLLEDLWERYPGQGIPDLEMTLYRPDLVDPDPADRDLVERIFLAYEKASRVQQDVAAEYQPSSMWQATLQTAYAALRESLSTRNLAGFHHFLANFGALDVSTGIEESRLLRRATTRRATQRHLERKIMGPQIQWWLRVESDGRDLSALEIPRHGNLGGVLVDGHLISPGSVFGDVHARLVTGFIDTERPVIGELGGGFGRLAYLLSRHLDAFRYVGFDLPETLCCATYYLMKSFPEKRFLLYGEEPRPAALLGEYDVVLLPSFELPTLPDDSVDLFLNENSLGGVTAEACRNYVTEMCRCTRVFWHRNHEFHRLTFSDGTTSLLNREYPVPAEFELIARYGDLAAWVRTDRLSRSGDLFWYAYRARPTAGGAASGPGG